MRAGAAEEAKERFKRKMWRRAVEGRGKLHPELEKAIKKKGFHNFEGM